MKPRVKVATALSPDRTVLDLIEHDGDYVINADGLTLMSTRMHHSEEELARLACAGLRPGARVLVGGLGLGYTLRAALDLLPAGGRVVQVELVPEVVAWNRGPLAPFAGRPLDDPRVDLVVADVGEVVRRADREFAAIMLDVDNGPSPLVTEKNAGLYSARGLQELRRALVPGGCLAIWSSDDDPGFPSMLRANGFAASHHYVRARAGSGRAHHVIFIGRKHRDGLPPRRPPEPRPPRDEGRGSGKRPRRRRD